MRETGIVPRPGYSLIEVPAYAGTTFVTPVLAFPIKGESFDRLRMSGAVIHPHPKLPPSRGKGLFPHRFEVPAGAGTTFLTPVLVFPIMGESFDRLRMSGAVIHPLEVHGF